MLLDSLHCAISSPTWVFNRSFSVPYALFSMLGGSIGTGCEEVWFPVHGGRDSRDVSVAGVCDCVKENEFYNVNDHLVSTGKQIW